MGNILSLNQSEFLKGRRHFELREGGELHISSRNRQGEQAYTVGLRNLSDKTMTTKGRSLVAWIFGWGLAIGLLATTVTILIGLRPDPIGGRLAVAGFIGIIFAPFMTAAFKKAIQSTYDVTVFYNRWNGQVAFTVANGRPDATTTAQFVELLTKEIQRAAPFEAQGDQLADQLVRLSELRARGVLSDPEFAVAKQRLLNMGVEEKKIGFSA